MEDRGGRDEDGLRRAHSEVRDAAIITLHRVSQNDNISDQISPQYAMVHKSSNGSGSGADRYHPSEGDTWSETGGGNSETMFVYPENDEEYGEGDSGIMVRDRNQSPPYDATVHHTVVTISNNDVVESVQSNGSGDGDVASASYVTSDVISESSYKSTTEEPNTVSTHGSTTSGVVVPWSTPSESVYETMKTIPPPTRSVQNRNGPRLDDSIQVEIDTVSHPMGKRQPRFNTEVCTLQNFYDDGFLEAMKWRTRKRYARRRKKYLAAIITILFIVLLLIAVVVGLLLYSNGTFGYFPMGTKAKENGGNLT
ncbi:hypothetical protein HOLleu_40336 [Holothuria leucospilota]|uniref:Uncharacterized protein n=1 Tax=Holothuria leucospilota TaxID=206669 RepID=A0A9Q0YDH9_HOLLE|nr:hypothetical protein HOLleu_40336 [Holothuria leucospilota]